MTDHFPLVHLVAADTPTSSFPNHKSGSQRYVWDLQMVKDSGEPETVARGEMVVLSDAAS